MIPILKNCLTVMLASIAMAATGCAGNSGASESSLLQGTKVGAIEGRVHGGQQPVVGSHLYVYAAGGSYASIAGKSTNQGSSVSLLTAGAGRTQDGNGNFFVTTDGGGGFSLTGDYGCTPGTQVYLLALGGNPGLGGANGGNNPSIGLMAGLGQCPTAGTLALQAPFVILNEVTTVATAYALAGFSADATHIASSGSTQAQAGIATAMGNVTQIVSLASGSALSVTSAGTGLVPTKLINTISNILASCVNSDGTSSTCATLFGSAVSPSGVSATDTATAALYIAKRPAAGVGALFGLASASAAFAPTLSSQPADFSLGIQFGVQQNFFPQQLAIDGNGNIWVDGVQADGTFLLVKYSATGQVLATSAAQSFSASEMAIDASNNLWVASNGNAYEFSSNGALVSPAMGYTCSPVSGYGSVAFGVDGSIYLPFFYTTGTGNNLTSHSGVQKLSPSGTCSGQVSALAGVATGSLNIRVDGAGDLVTTVSSVVGTNLYSAAPNGALRSTPSSSFYVAIDSSNNIWSVPFEYSSALATLTPGGVTGGGYSANSFQTSSVPANIPVIDGDGSVWQSFLNIPGNGSANAFVTGYTSAGVPLTASTGLTASAGSTSKCCAAPVVDNAGGLWVLAQSGPTAIGGPLTEYLGLAAPVATPILPSHLGQRP
jgi:hypothetical protein